MSFKEPIPALSNVMDTNGHASPIRKRGARAGCGNRLRLTGIRSLKLPGPGAVAHMSLHQKTNDVKEPSNVRKRTTNRSPIYTGGPAVRSELATDANRAG